MLDARLEDMSWIDFWLNKAIPAIPDIIQIIKNAGAVDLEHFNIPVQKNVIST